MNISVEVTGDILEYLDTKVRTGLFKSRSEVIRSAIREMIRGDIETQLRARGLTPSKVKKMRTDVARDILENEHPELLHCER